jgi:PAS domain S-box-containing protein
LLEVMLTPEGFVLLTAGSGEEALAMVAEHPPDLILLDVMMPGMNGYQVAARIKDDRATKNIPIIMVTALDDRNARMLGLRAGAEEFLTKPVDRGELCVRVKNLLRLKNYSDYFAQYSQMLEGQVALRTADLIERTKQAAVLSEQAALLDLAQDAIVVQDMQNRIVFWSRGAEAMYGWPAAEAVGQAKHERLTAQFSRPTEEIEVALLRDGQWTGEVIHHKRDGAPITVVSRWALQRDPNGAPVRILTIDSDITERKKAEQVLAQSREDQLRFKDEFLSHVSHELRSPLTAIKQFSSILLGGLAGELNTEQREYQEIVLKNVRQLQAMIDDLLEVTRLETGKLIVGPERVSVPDAVTDVFNTLQGSARIKGVTLTHELPADLPAAHADQTRLRQILIILLDNAIKFTPAGGTAHLRAGLLADDPRFVRLDVSDTGCGISPAMAERIFERLYQESEHTDAGRKGLGLGLYICKELVTRQGGQIWVTSQPDKGSTFSFTLPVSGLDHAIVPVPRNSIWPTESVALVMVEMCFLDGWSSRESQEAWSDEARGLLQRHLPPEVAVLLPKMALGTEGERFCFIAAFVDEAGASALTDRIREPFDRLPHLKHTRLTVSVSYSMLRPPPQDVGQSMERIVANMAANLEESIQAQIICEAVLS